MGGGNELFLRPHIFRPVWAELRHRRSAHINDRVLLLFCIHLVRNAFDVYHRLASGPTLDAVFPPLDKRPIEIGIKVDLLALRVLGEVPLLEYDRPSRIRIIPPNPMSGPNTSTFFRCSSCRR